MHCVDAAKELPLIGRELDQFAFLTLGRSAHCSEIDAAVGEFGADRDLRRERGTPTTNKKRLLDEMASDRLGLKLCS